MIAPAPTKPNPVGIPVAWHEADGEISPIQPYPIALATWARFIYLKPSRWPGHAAQAALDALDQMVIAARRGRRAT